MLRYYSSGKWRIALASNKKENQTIRGFSSYIIPKFSFNSEIFPVPTLKNEKCFGVCFKYFIGPYQYNNN